MSRPLPLTRYVLSYLCAAPLPGHVTRRNVELTTAQLPHRSSTTAPMPHAGQVRRRRSSSASSLSRSGWHRKQ